MFDQMIKNLQHSNKAEWREFSRVLRGVYLTEAKFKPVCNEDVGTRNGKLSRKETHAPCLLGLGMSLVLMYQALAKAFDIKKAQHQRNQMLKHPGTC